MGLMDEKRGFSKRLMDAMRKADVDAQSPTGIAREFNLRYHGDPITAQGVRKWLAGRSLPSQDKLRVLAQWLGVSPQWLRFGEAEGEGPRRHPVLRQEVGAYRRDQEALLEGFNRLNEQHRKLILELVKALLGAEGR